MNIPVDDGEEGSGRIKLISHWYWPVLMHEPLSSPSHGFLLIQICICPVYYQEWQLKEVLVAHL